MATVFIMECDDFIEVLGQCWPYNNAGVQCYHFTLISMPVIIVWTQEQFCCLKQLGSMMVGGHAFVRVEMWCYSVFGLLWLVCLGLVGYKMCSCGYWCKYCWKLCQSRLVFQLSSVVWLYMCCMRLVFVNVLMKLVRIIWINCLIILAEHQT